MAAGLLDEEQLVDELLDFDVERCEGSSPPKRPKPCSHRQQHHQHHHHQRQQQQQDGRDGGGEESRSRPGPSASADGGNGATAASGLAAEAAAAFSRLSAGSSGSPAGSKAAAEAAAAFAVGDGSARPPGTIHPGGTLALPIESAADLQRLHDRQWDWALAVHGSEEAALAAGWKAKDEPDYALYSVYMGRVRRCLESPDAGDAASETGSLLLRMVLAFRAYMACLYASGTFVMEHRYSNLETLSQLGELSAEVASLSGGRHQDAYRNKGSGAANGSADGAAAASDGTARSRSAGLSIDADGSGGDLGGLAAQEGGKADGAEEAGSTLRVRSRRSESAPVVQRPSGMAAADVCSEESPRGGDGRRGRRSLDLSPLINNSAKRPGAERLKKAYRDRATMDVRPTITAIKFSPQQRQEVLQRRRELDAELGSSQADRKCLLARLQGLTMRGGGSGGSGRGDITEASAALRANLDAEGRLITDFSAWFTCRLLTPLQHAHCNATCYPYMPDVIGISDVLAAER